MTVHYRSSHKVMLSLSLNSFILCADAILLRGLKASSERVCQEHKQSNQRISKTLSSDTVLTIKEKTFPTLKVVPSPKVFFMQQNMKDIWALPPSLMMHQ